MEGSLDNLDVMNARKFIIAVKRLASSLSYGTDRSAFLGSGVEYVQSRPYQYGDPIRAIDWRVTARTGRVFVKEFEAPKRLPCYLLFDTSASMTVSSGRKSKYAMAVHLAGGIAFACLDRVSPVGLVCVGQRELRYNPSLSRDQVMQWLHQLRHFRYDESTTLSASITELTPSVSERALFIVLSDMHDPRALPSLKRLAQAHDVAVLQMRDPAEDGLRGAGLLRAQEAESGRAFVVSGRKVKHDQSELTQELKRVGVDHLLLTTDQPFVQKVRYFFASRNLLGKGAR